MHIRWAYLKRVLAGAIFGLYMAHLLYFLNPQIDITPGRLATVTIVYGIICGVLFGSILWGLRALRVQLFGGRDANAPYRAHGFGFVVLAAFISAAIYWMHLSVLRSVQYLPVGAVRILSKSTNLITATAFVLLLLWVLERSATRSTSRAIFAAGVALIAVSSFFLYQRRDSYHTERRTVVVANVGTVAGQRPVIVVAIRNLPYDWLLTLAGEGAVPAFDRLKAHGYLTRVEPFPTTSPKALWASLATGKLPYRHGVTGRFSYRTPLNRDEPFLMLPSGVGFRAWGLIPPVERISAQLPAGDALPLWALFERVAFHAAAIAWPSSLPSGASRVVTDSFFDVRDKAREVVPPSFAPTALQLANPQLRPFAQRFNAAGPRRNEVLAALGRDLTATAIARQSIGEHRFELNVVALEGFADAQRVLHVFSNELPLRTSVKGEAMRAYAEQLDRIIGELAADFPDHLLVVVAPSGVVPPAVAGTPFEIVRDWLVDDDPGADDGFILLTGPGVAHSDRPASAYVTDLVPTVLYGAGLPVGRDMDGRVLTDAFTDEFLRRTTLSVIQTYEAKNIVVRRGGA